MTAEREPAGGGLADELAAARAGVLAAVDAIGESGGPSLRPATVTSATRLREPPAALAAKLDTRARAGLAPEGWDYPRRRSVIVLGTTIAVLGAAAVVGLIGTVLVFAVTIGTAPLLPVIMGLLAGLAGLGLGAGAVARYAAGDPLRLSTADRRTLAAARYWQSRQGWIGPLSGSPERRLVLVARDLVERIVTSPAWTSGQLDGHRTQLDLAAELDQIDEQAYQLAQLRATLTGSSDPVSTPDQSDDALAQGWQALVDRVAALAVYASKLGGLDRQLADKQAADRLLRADQQIAALLAGAARDDLAADQLRALTEELTARRDLPAGPTTSAVSPESET